MVYVRIFSQRGRPDGNSYFALRRGFLRRNDTVFVFHDRYRVFLQACGDASGNRKRILERFKMASGNGGVCACGRRGFRLAEKSFSVGKKGNYSAGNFSAAAFLLCEGHVQYQLSQLSFHIPVGCLFPDSDRACMGDESVPFQSAGGTEAVIYAAPAGDCDYSCRKQ